MSVNGTHLDYGASLPAWSRARDVLAGEDAVKAAGVRYLPRLDSQSEEEYAAYKARASVFGGDEGAGGKPEEVEGPLGNAGDG